jgi:Asp-tRNA(Asn)/Glu-tRNA(Gln) amidotransferase A subunit family amidase
MIPSDLERLAELLRRGSVEIDDCLDVLEETIQARELEVLALVDESDRFERLRREAAALRQRYPDPVGRPPLYGVPVGVKDIFRVDGLPTGAGSRLPVEEFAGEESAAVGHLRAAGALVLAKTVSTEFAYFAPGPTRNPRNVLHTPGGSSSGSAAAVAAGECPLALGTQTIGSVSRPASFCGVVGYKPSYDRISRHGVVPLSPSLDHVGTFTTTVAGARLAAETLCEKWRSTEETREPVLGVWAGLYLNRAASEGFELFERVCTRLTDSGYRIERVDLDVDLDRVERRHRILVAAEAAQVHEEWFVRYADLYHPKTAELLVRGRAVSAVELDTARASRLDLRRTLMLAMMENGVDLWISPSARGVAPRGLESTGDPVMNLPWTHAGLPTLSIPAVENSEGLPFGLQIAGGWWEDERLLAWSLGIEQALAAGRQSPEASR